MQPEQLAVSMWSTHRRFESDATWTVENFLEVMAGLGMTRVELLSYFWRDRAKELPKVRQRLRDQNMTVVAFAVDNDFGDDQPGRYEAAIEAITDGIAVAQELDAPVVRVFTGDVGTRLPLEEVLARAVSGLQTAAVAATNAGVTLAIENHGRLAGKSSQILDLIRRIGSPSVRSNADVGNFLLADEAPENALSALAGNIRHVHLKDLAPARAASEEVFESLAGTRYEGQAVGAGILPWKAIVAALEAQHYTGALSIEFEGAEDELSGVRQSIAFLQSQLGQL